MPMPSTAGADRPADADDAAVWRRLLPPEVCVSCGDDVPIIALTDAERLSLGIAGEARVREFTAGRLHARRALAALGVAVTDLPRGQRGQPVWPAGVTGSIAHRTERGLVHAVAAVARTSHILALGIDTESQPAPAPRTWSSLLLPDELAGLLDLPPNARGAEVLALWCAKEAVAKASGRFDDVRRIAVRRRDDDAFEASVASRDVANTAAPTGFCWTGRISAGSGRTFAVVVRRPPPS